jgi:hypothetical protein
MHTGELEVSNPTHVGWDKFKAQGGKTIWRNYQEPSGTDLIDHLRREAVTEHAEEGSNRQSATDKAGEILSQINGQIPRGKRKVGTRSRGKSQDIFVGTNPVTKQTVPITEPNLVDKPTGKEGGLNRGRVDSSGNPVPQPIKARTGKVNVRQTGVALPQDVLAKDAKEKRAQRAKEIFGTRPDKGVTSGPTNLPRVTTEQRRINAAQRKIELGKISEKVAKEGAPPAPGVPRQMMLAGMSNYGGPDIKTPASTEGVYKVAEGPLEEWHARGAAAKMPTTGKPFLPKQLEVKVGEKTTPGTSTPSGKRDTKAARAAAEGGTLPESGLAQLKLIKEADGLAGPKMSESKELEVRPGGKKQASNDRTAGKLVAKKAAAAKKAPVQLSLFGQGRQWIGGTNPRVSEATQKLQGQASAPRGEKPNPFADVENAATKMLEQNATEARASYPKPIKPSKPKKSGE